MNWLFWKEYRQNRVVVITLLLTLIVPHAFGLYAIIYDWHRNSWQSLPRWQETLCGASIYSLGLSQLALALIGGNAIAGERADRSAEFQAYLPLSREKILAGKLLLVLAIVAVIWSINPLIVWSTMSSWGGRPPIPSMSTFMINTAITGLVFFCAAWFFSQFLRSPTFSFAAGLATPAVIISLMAYGAYLILDKHESDKVVESMLQTGYVCVSLAVAVFSFGIGTWLYLRRVEP
jgi:ABC-type transport system involved in multi-copper enzyme maturation permease subunit